MKSIYAYFNATSRQFVGFGLAPAPNAPTSILQKEIPVDDNFDLGIHTWEGNYDSGRLVGKYEEGHKEVVYESMIKQQRDSKLTTRYTPMDILWTLMNQLALLIHKGVISNSDVLPETAKLLELQQKLDKQHQRSVNFYKESTHHRFIDEIEQQRRAASQFQTKNENT